MRRPSFLTAHRRIQEREKSERERRRSQADASYAGGYRLPPRPGLEARSAFLLPQQFVHLVVTETAGSASSSFVGRQSSTP